MLTYFCQVVGGGSVRRREGAKFCYTCVNARPPVWVLGDPGGMGVSVEKILNPVADRDITRVLESVVTS